MNKHQIWFLSLYEDMDFILLEKEFSYLFGKEAAEWFDEEVLTRFPHAIKCYDSTLAGYHWSVGAAWFELR